MGKFWMLFLFVFLSYSISDARYIRKVREPDFFIPESDRMHKPEKLPVIEKKQVKKIKEDIFKEIPEYKNKYNKYLSDMEIFKKTGFLPYNEDLEKDLSCMETGKVFEVITDDVNTVKTKEQNDFYLLVKDIIKN